MSAFFINRPIFAWVIAIVIMLSGIFAINSLPIAQYPTIAPPAIEISASYPGESAKAVEDSVTQVIEQGMTGLDNLLYMSSKSDSSGSVSITLTFSAETDPDIAQVQVQNSLQQVENSLPSQVQAQGVSIRKNTSGFISMIAIYSPDNSMSTGDIQDYVNSYVKDPVSRVSGVGDVNVFGPSYAMRIWLDPTKLNSLKMTPSDVYDEIAKQNSQVTLGQLGGAPSTDDQQFNATIKAQSLLTSVDGFKNILLKVNTDGSQVRLQDVATVELSSESFSAIPTFNGQGTSGIGVTLASGANTLDTQASIDAKLEELSKSFPNGLKVAKAMDTTPFIKLSIEEVVYTLIEAIVLVFFVMLLFLQNFRATLIPTIAVPVVLLGTFGVMSLAGFSLNTLTMFGLVLAIGLLVDDAIVVVENVERLMHEEGLSAKDATRKSMTQITGALVGITTVLAVVFVPMALMDGSTGAIYRQFSVTIVSAMVLSVIVALILTPVLCATLLKAPTTKDEHKKNWFFKTFNKGFNALAGYYNVSVGKVLKRPLRSLSVYALLLVACGFIYQSLPSSFLPDEDQGNFTVMVQSPNGSTLKQTAEVMQDITDYYQENEKDTVNTVFGVSGFNFSGRGQNAGMALIGLKDWSERTEAGQDVNAIIERTMAHFKGYKKGSVIAVNPPSIRQLGNATGFDFYLEDMAAIGHDKLLSIRNQLIEEANQHPALQKVRANGLEDNAQFVLDIDYEKAKALGIDFDDINNTLSIAWGSSYVNDFIDRGRSKKVYIQAQAQYRMTPEDIDAWYVRNGDGNMVPINAFSSSHWEEGSPQLIRYNGNTAFEIVGEAAPGYSTGDAMSVIESISNQISQDTAVSWTGTSYQELEAGNQAAILYAVSILMVFLCLAALYESWSIPISVILIIPLGVLGALVATYFRGLESDVYFQVGVLTTIGLSAKNAILIVEFAKELMEKGASVLDAAVQACRMRLRPIIMTSMAFVLGVLPLVVSSGAGANSRQAIGTSVMGGMLSATLLVIFFVPLFFVLIQKYVSKSE
ncbi:efflux RND transporter permease subunit [Pseudoalteromonas sp. AOP31-A2-14]|uniref:efflux RND transporter permease subunit n=3 Tax=Pseudoalteromonas TaxID=53246 RepID=UPI003F9AF620